MLWYVPLFSEKCQESFRCNLRDSRSYANISRVVDNGTGVVVVVGEIPQECSWCDLRFSRSH